MRSAPPQFPAGFFWQLFGFWAGSQATPVGFAFATGAGDAFGVLAGQLALSGVLRWLKPDEWTGWTDAVLGAVVVAFGSFCSGTVWQPMLDTAILQGLAFTPAATVVGVVCGLCFLLGYSAAGAVARKARGELAWPARGRWHAVLLDTSLAVGVGGGAAFFVGTDRAYAGNWLAPLVGERNNRIGQDSLRAGGSTAIGFAVIQTVLLLTVPWGGLWTDGGHPFDPDRDNDETDTDAPGRYRAFGGVSPVYEGDTLADAGGTATPELVVGAALPYHLLPDDNGPVDAGGPETVSSDSRRQSIYED